jgi:hypothetical protein
MELEGLVHLIGEEQVVGSAGTFKKRTIVIATKEQYVQYVPIDFVQDKCSILDKYSVGQDVKISVNVRGNEYQGKYYVSLNGWRIENLSSGTPSENYTKTVESSKQFGPPIASGDEVDDLPF